MALYNIPIGLKCLLLLTNIKETRHLQDSRIYRFDFLYDTDSMGSIYYPLHA